MVENVLKKDMKKYLQEKFCILCDRATFLKCYKCDTSYCSLDCMVKCKHRHLPKDMLKDLQDESESFNESNEETKSPDYFLLNETFSDIDDPPKTTKRKKTKGQMVDEIEITDPRFKAFELYLLDRDFEIAMYDKQYGTSPFQIKQ